MLKIPTLTCTTFTLRQLNKKDAESIAKYGNNKKIAKNLTDRFPLPYKIENAQEFIKKILSKKNLNSYAFGIDIGGEIVGTISLGLKTSHKASLGYWLGESFWGKGIMTEALNKVVDFGFKNLKLKRIEAQVYPHNEASAAILLKNGFEKEGYLRKSEMHWGKLMDTILFAKVK